MKLPRTDLTFDPDDHTSVIAACRAHDAKAQRALVKHYYGYVKSIALRYTASDQDADEIINDSFLKVFGSLHKYDDRQAFRGWLRTIVVNTSIDCFRKNKSQPGHTDYDEAEKHFIPDISENIISRMSADEILALVRKLTPVYRTVFSLYVIDGYTHKEIAEKLGFKEGTSKSNLQDARRKLQSMILERNPNPDYAYELKPLPRNED